MTTDVITDLRDEFPITSEYCYLDASAYGPNPRCFVQRASEAAAHLAQHPMGEASRRTENVRELAARLVHTHPERVALIPSTGFGLSLMALGRTWTRGDEVIVYEREFPAAVAPWLALQRDGVRVKVIRDRGRDGFTVQDVADLLTPRTRAICVSYVNWENGFCAPVEQLRTVCEGRDVWIVCDAVQAMGVLPLDADTLDVDILAAQGFKYLLSGFGCGVAALSRRAVEELRPAHIGYRALEDPDTSRLLAADRLSVRDDVRRFEMSSPSIPTVFGMEASLDLLLRPDPHEISRHVLHLAERLTAGLIELGYQVARFDDAAGQQSHVVVADHEDLSLDAVHARLLDQRTVCSLRRGRLRFGLHLYNNDDDIDHTLAQLAELAPTMRTAS